MTSTLLMNPVDFALQTCLDGAVYGVKTSCNRCETLFNSCLQERLQDLFVIKQTQTERTLGYPLTVRYVSEIFTWNGQETYHITQFPGIVTVNVKEQAVYQFDLPINPFILEDLEIVSGVDYCYVILDKTIIKNPEEVILWSPTDRIVERHAEYRVSRDNDGNWIYPLSKPYANPPCVTEDTLKASHCKFVYIDVPIVEECDELVATYYGTSERIPLYQIESIDESTNRYWFYVWALKDNAFEYADFSLGEFYKLYENISFYCFNEVEQLPIVTKIEKCGCPPFSLATDTLLQTDILNSVEGQILFQRSQRVCDCHAVLQVEIFYKIDPEILPYFNREALLEALAYEVASYLPIKTCNCPIESGFIATAQMPFDKIRVNPLAGTETIELQYGKMYGHLFYTDEIDKLYHWQRVLRP